jgi:hypothetical protein
MLLYANIDPTLNWFAAASSGFFYIEVRGAASSSAYYGYPELWILRYLAHRHAGIRTHDPLVESPTS